MIEAEDMTNEEQTVDDTEGEAVVVEAEGQEPAVPDPEGHPAWTKVVLMEGTLGTTVGVQDSDRHPVLTTLAGVRMDEALAQVPELLREARAGWQERPKYETYTKPPARPGRQTRRATVNPTPAAAPAAPPQHDPQQRLF